MRHPRFVAILGSRDRFGVRKVLEIRAEHAGLARAFTTPGASVFSLGKAPLLLPAGKGVVLGHIYSRGDGTPPTTAGDEAESRAIGSPRGQELIDQFWGDYVAILAEEKQACVLRPPFSNLPCLHTMHRGLTIVASDLALLEACTAVRPSPDWDIVASHILTGGLRSSRTCVTEVEELLWASRVVVANSGMTIEECWSPWAHTACRRAEHADVLASEFWDLARTCVAAQIGDLGSVAVMLSGGLDSSLLASLVAECSARMTCLNLTSGDAGSDERHFARLVAENLGIPCHELEHELAHVDVSVSHARGQPRPIARSFAQASRAAKLSIARDAGALAILDGGGGDNLFCSLQSVTPVADRILSCGLGAGTLATAADLARFTETSILTILPRAMRRAWLRPPCYSWPIDATFLSEDAALRAGPPRHRWLNPPRGNHPGSAAHVALMIAVECLLETADGEIPEWSPFIAQPLVEFALSIPSWRWFEHGNNRAIARRALARRQPREVAWRRGKGSPDAFVARVFEKNRAKLGELLLDGKLANEGLLDRGAIEAQLARQGPATGILHSRLLKIADVEAWVRTL